MPINTSHRTVSLKKKLKHIERSIKSAQLRGFSTKKLNNARSQYIEILKKRGAL